MLVSLLLPILLTTVTLFVASFLTWMVLPLHFNDWRKLPQEDGLMGALTEIGIQPGNYMFPGWDTPEEMKSQEYQDKWAKGPNGIMTVFPKVSMGKNLGLTFVYFLVVTFCLAYLATLALPAGAAFMPVFRFVTTAGLLTFLPAILSHAIWFHNRVVGHVIESIAYALIVGSIFAAMWPATV